MHRLEKAEAERDAAQTALNEVERLARDLYRHVQAGAGCCGDAIGRGDRGNAQASGFPPYQSEGWLSPADVAKVRAALLSELKDENHAECNHAEWYCRHTDVLALLSKRGAG